MKNPFLIDLKEKVIKQSKFTSDNFEFFRGALKSAEEKGYSVHLDYCTASESKVESIKNWLRYRLRFELRCGMYECDIDDNVFNLYNLIFHENNSRSEKIRRKNRAFKVKETVLETDTMNSFATVFNQFIRQSLPNGWNKDYPKLFNISLEEATKTDFYRDLFFLINIEEWYKCGFTNQMSEKGTAAVQEVFEEFNKFASLTHCLANMILVPFNYNVGRAAITKDFWDLTLIDLQERYTQKQHYDGGFTFICENMETLMLTDWFEDLTAGSFDKYTVKLLFKEHSYKKKIPVTNDEYLECIKGINQMIEKRAERLFEKFPDFKIQL